MCSLLCVFRLCQVYEVPPQQILSTDSVTLTVDAVIYYRVFDPVKAATRLANYNKSVCALASATLGSILGTYRLAALLSDRQGKTLSLNQ